MENKFNILNIWTKCTIKLHTINFLQYMLFGYLFLLLQSCAGMHMKHYALFPVESPPRKERGATFNTQESCHLMRGILHCVLGLVVSLTGIWWVCAFSYRKQTCFLWSFKSADNILFRLAYSRRNKG